jgi:hypothetical protein
MRYYKKEKVYPEYDAKRVVKRFALLPISEKQV